MDEIAKSGKLWVVYVRKVLGRRLVYVYPTAYQASRKLNQLQIEGLELCKEPLRVGTFCLACVGSFYSSRSDGRKKSHA